MKLTDPCVLSMSLVVMSIPLFVLQVDLDQKRPDRWTGTTITGSHAGGQTTPRSQTADALTVREYGEHAAEC